MTYEASPVGATGWESILTDPSTDIEDLAFAIAACRLESLDNDIQDMIGNLHINTELKKAYRDRLIRLKEYLEKSDPDSDTIDVPVKDAVEMGYAWEEGKVTSSVEGDVIPDDAEFFFYIGDERTDIAADPFTKQEAIDYAFGNPDVELHVEVDKAEFEAMISRLEGKLDDLSTNSQLELLDINRSMSRRNQVLQLASNIMSTSHQSSMSIIANIK